jgi:hypothetical protein
LLAEALRAAISADLTLSTESKAEALAALRRTTRIEMNYLRIALSVKNQMWVQMWSGREFFMKSF